MLLGMAAITWSASCSINPCVREPQQTGYMRTAKIKCRGAARHCCTTETDRQVHVKTAAYVLSGEHTARHCCTTNTNCIACCKVLLA